MSSSRSPKPAAAASTADTALPKIMRKPCVLVFGPPHARRYIGGQKLGRDTDIQCNLLYLPKIDAESWFGFAISFPLAAGVETMGLGK